jgi:protease II
MGGHIATGSTAGGAFIDVEDCVKGARHLVAIGCADADRLMISGGSAGGVWPAVARFGIDNFALRGILVEK